MDQDAPAAVAEFKLGTRASVTAESMLDPALNLAMTDPDADAEGTPVPPQMNGDVDGVEDQLPVAPSTPPPTKRGRKLAADAEASLRRSPRKVPVGTSAGTRYGKRKRGGEEPTEAPAKRTRRASTTGAVPAKRRTATGARRRKSLPVKSARKGTFSRAISTSYKAD